MPVITLSEEITATSQTTADEAIAQAIARAAARLTEIKKVEVKKVEEVLQGGNVSGYRVTLKITHASGDEPELGRKARSEAEARLSSRPRVRLPRLRGVPLRTDEDGTVRVGRTRVTLDTVITAFRLGESAEGIAEQYPSLNLADVYNVLGYYLRYRDAVEDYIADREREAGQLREQIEAELDPTGLRARLLARRPSGQ